MGSGNRESRSADTDARVKEVMRRAKNIEIDAWEDAGMGSTGVDHASRPRGGGGGMEFSEVREYVSGDDPRRIDWNVTARYGRIYVKEFAEERSPGVYVMMDRSASTLFGSAVSKRTTMMEIGASIIISALRCNNAVGLGIFSETLDRFVSAKRGRRHAIGLVRKMVEIMDYNHDCDSQDAAGTCLGESVLGISEIATVKGIVFIITDCATGRFAREMRRLSASHTVVVISVYDPHERRMPEIGYAHVEDAETGEQVLVDTSNKEFQDAYLKASQKEAASTRDEALAGGASHVEIASGEPFDVILDAHAIRAAKMTRSARSHTVRRRRA